MTGVLDRSGYPWRGIDKPEAAEIDEPEDGWSGAVICSGEDPVGAFLLCRHLRKREVPLAPVMVVVPVDQLGELELREDLFDDLCLEPVNPDELSARLAHLFWRTGRGLRPDLLEHGPLVLNLETYQAAVAGQGARPDLHGVRAAPLPGRPAGQGVHPRDPAQPGLGLRVLRRAPAPSTCTSGGCGPSWARSTPT